jgi:hypothetical protein
MFHYSRDFVYWTSPLHSGSKRRTHRRSLHTVARLRVMDYAPAEAGTRGDAQARVCAADFSYARDFIYWTSPPHSGSKRRTHRRSLQCSLEMYAAVSRRAGTRNLSYAASTWGEALNASALKHQKCSCSKQRTRLMATYACPSAKNCARTARAAG